MALSDCRWIELPVVREQRGNLAFVESGHHVPFAIERIYYLFDVPGGAERGGHAHLELEQLVIALAGSFTVHLDDGQAQQSMTLNRPSLGLYLPPMTWRTMDDFSGGSVCLVLASAPYDESDYLRGHSDFVERARG